MSEDRNDFDGSVVVRFDDPGLLRRLVSSFPASARLEFYECGEPISLGSDGFDEFFKEFDWFIVDREERGQRTAYVVEAINEDELSKKKKED